MKELVKNVRVQEVWRQCDNGCEGALKFTGNVLTSYPAQYVYMCPVCRNYYNLLEKIPTYRYVEVIESDLTKNSD